MSGAGGAGVAEAASPSWFMATAPASEGAGPVDGPSRLDRVDGPVVALTPSADLLGDPLWHASQGGDERARFDEAHAQLDNPARGKSKEEILLGVIGLIAKAVACPATRQPKDALDCKERFRKERMRLELARNYLGMTAPAYYLQPRFLGGRDLDAWQLSQSAAERGHFDSVHELIDRGQQLNAVRFVACNGPDNRCWARFTGERMRLELVREARRRRETVALFDELGHQPDYRSRSRVRTLSSSEPSPELEPSITQQERAPAPAPAPEGASSGWPMRLVRILSSSNAAPAEPTPAPLRLKLPPAVPVVNPEELTPDDVRALIVEASDAERAQLEELVAAMGQGRGWLGTLWDTLAGWFTSDDDSDGPTGVAPLLLTENAGAGPAPDAGDGVEASRGGFFDLIGRTQDKVVTVAKWALIAAAVLGVGWLIVVAVIAPCVVPAIAGVLNTGITTGGTIGGKSLDAGTALVKGGLGGLLMGS